MDTISALLPSRGRPDSLARAVASLRGGRSGVEVVVGLDEDDPGLDEARKAAEGADQIVIAPRHRTLHALLNTLQRAATGAWFFPFCDDHLIDNFDWADRLRPTLEMLPNKLGVAHLSDPGYPEFATFPVVSREMVEMNGFFMPPWHPFLFGDTWWHEIGVLCGVKIRADVAVCHQDGVNDHHYRDLLLWVRMFERTRPMRTEVAIRITRAIFGASQEGDQIVGSMNGREELCRRYMAHQQTPEWLARWEHVGRYDNPRYDELRTQAINFMRETEAA